ncbi:MAG: ribonuclease III [Proteobacteria bacterium]|nr:ribonuclease III [Pseudomonadota bacterium]
MNAQPRLDILEKNIGYAFKDRSFLVNALCHRSYLNENQESCDCDNERLEFLGDAVLGLCIGHILMEKSPSKREGELSKLRSNLVSEPGLADMARSIDLGRFINLGKGEFFSGGRDKNSILSDAFEAVIAAVYLDAGFDKTHPVVAAIFQDAIQTALFDFHPLDYKSTLQEYAQETFATTPRYTVVKEIGPDHDKTFEICLELADIKATGVGKTKKAAEQDSARNVLAIVRRPKG